MPVIDGGGGIYITTTHTPQITKSPYKEKRGENI